MRIIRILAAVAVQANHPAGDICRNLHAQTAHEKKDAVRAQSVLLVGTELSTLATVAGRWRR
jgi:hypothetical protein